MMNGVISQVTLPVSPPRLHSGHGCESYDPARPISALAPRIAKPVRPAPRIAERMGGTENIGFFGKKDGKIGEKIGKKLIMGHWKS